MAASIAPRPYQVAAFQQACGENTIVNFETGLGKTLVASMCADHFLQCDRSKKVVVAVTTLALAKQQASVLRESSRIPDIRVAELVSGSVQWTPEFWDRLLQNNDILVGIGQVLQKAIVDTGFFPPSRVGLLVLDECHHAVGNHPFVSIIQDGFCGLPLGQPRILGLTASFLHGKCEQLVQKRIKLEAVLKGKIWCPEPADIQEFLSERTFSTVDFSSNGQDFNFLTEEAADLLQRTLTGWANLGFMQDLLTEMPKLSEKAARVMHQSGFHGWRRHLSKLAQAAKERRHLLPPELHPQADELLRGFESWCPEPLAQPCKLLSLLELLRTFEDGLPEKESSAAAAAASYRCIIFVEEVVDTLPLTHVLNLYFEDQVAAHISGGSSMTATQQKESLARFRDGKVRFLVATQAVEEGIDVPSCNFVVRYDAFHNVKSHIQGAGRARMKHAHIYYFENNCEEEEAAAELMKQVARQELPEELEETRRQPWAYTHETTGAKLDPYNCLPILYEFVQSFSGGARSVRFDKELSTEGQPWISSCCVPLPDGTELVTTERQVAEFWLSVAKALHKNGDAEDPPEEFESRPTLTDFLCVLDEDRSKHWDHMDHLERRAALVAVVSLIESGQINDRNLPALGAAAGCFLLPRTSEEREASCPGLRPGPQCDSDDEDEIVSYVTRPLAAFLEEEPQSSEASTQPARSLLNQLLEAHLGRSLRQDDIVVTSESTSGDQVVVTLQFGNFDGKAGSGKKFVAGPVTKTAAEEAAAAQACNWLRSLSAGSNATEAGVSADSPATSSCGHVVAEEPEQYRLELEKEIEKRLHRPAQTEDFSMHVQQDGAGLWKATLCLGSFAGKEAAGERFQSEAFKRKRDATEDVCSKAVAFLTSLDIFNSFLLQEPFVIQAADFVGYWRDSLGNDAVVSAGGLPGKELSVKLSRRGRDTVQVLSLTRNPQSQCWSCGDRVLDEKSSTKSCLLWSTSGGERSSWQRSTEPIQSLVKAVSSSAPRTRNESAGGYVLAQPTGAQSSPGWGALQDAGNWKGMVQEHVQQVTRKTPTTRELAYRDRQVEQGFQSEVYVELAHRCFVGRVFATKKDSQQDAAREAYQFLTGRKGTPGCVQVVGPRSIPPSAVPGTMCSPLVVAIVRPDGKEKQVMIPPQITVARALNEYRPAALEGKEVEAEVDGAVVSNDLTFGELAKTKKQVRLLIKAKADW